VPSVRSTEEASTRPLTTSSFTLVPGHAEGGLHGRGADRDGDPAMPEETGRDSNSVATCRCAAHRPTRVTQPVDDDPRPALAHIVELVPVQVVVGHASDEGSRARLGEVLGDHEAL
jgi:hypothetical protein